MTTIRVQCETCKATLRVRDEGFVGEVHACPRCGSMVLIGGAGAIAASETSAHPAEAAAPPKPIALGLSETLETLDAPPIEPPPAETQTAEAPPAAKPLKLPTREDLDELEPVAPPRSNLFPLLTTIAALTATTAVGATWLLSGPDEPDEPVAAVAAPDPPAAPAPEIESITPEPQPEPAPVAPAPASTPWEEVAATETSETPQAQDLPPVETTAPQPTPERVASRSTARPPVAEPITREIDPLAFDPDQIDFALVGQAAPATAPTPVTPTDPTPGNAASPEPAQPVPVRDGVFVSLGSAGAPPSLSAEVALTQTLPRIELRGVPLAEACRVIGELSGAPITLSPATLRRAGVSADQPIDLVGEGETLGASLATALRPIRLAYQTDGPHTLVVVKGAEQERMVTHRLADLVGDSPSDLAALLGPSVDASLTISAAGELPLTAPMRTHYDLLVAAEELRLERGLPAGSKYPRRLLAESPEDALGKRLDRRTTFSFVEPTPLEEVFAYWRRAAGVEMLVDWRALAEAGLGPRSTVTCSATNRPWRSALSGVLEPLGLTWRPAFGPAIAIGVPASGQ